VKNLLGAGWQRYRRWPVWAQLIAAIVVVGAVAAPFSSQDEGITAQAGSTAETTTSAVEGPTATTARPTTTTTVAPATTTTTTLKPATTTTLKPTTTTTAGKPASTTTTAKPSTTVPAHAALPGFASTRKQWNASHTKAKGYSDGSAYLPLIGGKQPTYAGVMDDDSRIISYDVYMAPGTSMTEAMARVLKELPADVKPGKLIAGDGCHIQEFRSASIENALSGMTVVVAYSDDDPTIPFAQRYRVATLIITAPGDEHFC
jgi:hypothetical protein